MKRLAFTLGGCVFLAGCVSMSGLDGESKFACKAPDGVTCESLSGVYANALAGNLPALRQGEKKNGAQASQDGPAPAAESAPQPKILSAAPTSGDPIRTRPRILRIWIAPWEDSDGDLHDQSYVYVVADAGRWLIEHHQRRIIDRFRPTVAPAGSAQPAARQPSQGGQPEVQSAARLPATGGLIPPGGQVPGQVLPQPPARTQ